MPRRHLLRRPIDRPRTRLNLGKNAGELRDHGLDRVEKSPRLPPLGRHGSLRQVALAHVLDRLTEVAITGLHQHHVAHLLIGREDEGHDNQQHLRVVPCHLLAQQIHQAEQRQAE
jgi:hypothetical protein